MLKTAVGIHWWTFSTPCEVEGVLDVLGGVCSETEYVGGFGHPMHVVHESGARVYFGSKVEGQPVVVNAPGEACEVAAEQLVRAAADLEGRVTRMDTAVDVGPAGLARRRISEMHRAWVRGKVKTRMAPGSHDLYKSQAADGGWTAYFGGKSAQLRLRAYDRRGPLRLEWQWRPEKDVGPLIPGMVLKKGVAAVWRGLAQAVVFPMPWYRELLEGERVEWSKPAPRENSFLQVLETLVAQWGPTLWAFQQVGVSLDELVSVPEKPRGRDVEKFLRWSDEATAAGYDGERLRRELQCRLKSARG